MCGIFFQLSAASTDLKRPPTGIEANLRCRGPDAQNQHAHRFQCRGDGGISTLSFYATVLSLRGLEPVSQPLIDQSTGSVLCWNGEVWKIDDRVVDDNDTVEVSALLAAVHSKDVGSEAVNNDGLLAQDPIILGLARIAGPFAIVYFDAISSKLYFGRDRLGRRSLLIKHAGDGFMLSSISDGTSGWTEVDADGIYVQQLGQDSSSVESVPQAQLVTWKSLGIESTFNRECPSCSSSRLTQESPAVSRLEELLRASMKLRLTPIFSSATNASQVACGTPIRADKSSAESLKQLASLSRDTASLGILFSGGLDCTVLARLAHEYLPLDRSIDLLNVAFDNPRNRNQLAEPGKSIYDLCPDRITGRSSAEELRLQCPGRHWRFVEVDVPYEVVCHHRPIVISLMHPHDTEMDLSIALALYFASRGQGCIRLGDQSVEYTTPARVLLSGLGADELFGGYQRHATAFRHRGHTGLVDELELDFSRLGKRNLGRDDRVISHWGREARYPFLDEDLVQWAVSAPVWEKCGFSADEMVNDVHGESCVEPGKLVLRLLAEKLGMVNVAREKKRAIQFGARTAKMEGKTTGTAKITQTEAV